MQKAGGALDLPLWFMDTFSVWPELGLRGSGMLSALTVSVTGWLWRAVGKPGRVEAVIRRLPS